MASGCIVGHCWVCDDLVWEDEIDIIDEHVIHRECREDAAHKNKMILQRFIAKEKRKNKPVEPGKREKDERVYELREKKPY
jgi:hypothetical protein